jgi:hypothetical protein
MGFGLRGCLSSLALLGAACEQAPQALAGEQVNMDANTLEPQLQALGRVALYFGHQSVGGNLLRGLEVLGREAGVTVPVRELGTAGGPGGIVHSRLGKNGDPAGKIGAFEGVLTGAEAGPVQLAAMKLCYADFRADTDVEALFARYVAAIDAIGAARPELKLLHVTTPLTARGEGVRHRLQRTLGMAPGNDRANAARHLYNERLRARYAGPALFDLARIEATGPDGKVLMYGSASLRHPALVAAYTDDGGHLNDAGQRRVAAAFAGWLARFAAP